jgi:hypothetical protein
MRLLHRLVSRLREGLPDGVVDGHADGCRRAADPGAVDARGVGRLGGQARDDAGPRRAPLLREALAWWRGPAPQDVDLPGAAFAADRHAGSPPRPAWQPRAAQAADVTG